MRVPLLARGCALLLVSLSGLHSGQALDVQQGLLEDDGSCAGASCGDGRAPPSGLGLLQSLASLSPHGEVYVLGAARKAPFPEDGLRGSLPPQARASSHGLPLVGTTSTAPSQTTERMSAKAMKRQDVDGIAKFARHWLGFPTDFWVLVSMLLGALAFFLAYTFITTRLATWWRAEHVPLIRPEVEPCFPKGWLQRGFIRWGVTAENAMMMDMAIRTALTCSVLGLTYFVPKLNHINQACFTMMQAAVIVIFSVDVDMGRTIQNWWETFLGTFLPALHAIVIFHFFPVGVKSQYDLAWYVGIVDFIAFSMVFICLNWPAGTCMFALSLQVGITMDFMNPESVTVYSDNLTTLALTGAEMGPLASSLISLVAVLVTLAFMPWGFIPSALGHAQEDAIRLAWREGSLWRQLAAGFCGDSRRVVDAMRLYRVGKKCLTDLEGLQSHMDPSWWECFGGCAWVRSLLMELQEHLETMNDWFIGAASALQSEEFGVGHARFVEATKAEMEQLCAASEELLFTSASLALRGIKALDARWQQEVHDLQGGIARVEAAQRAFASAFVSARGEACGDDLPLGLLHKHFFAFALSSYAEHTVSFAQYLLKGTGQPPVTVAQAAFERFVGVLRWSEDPGQARRTCVAFFASAIVGYFGIPDVMSPLDGSVASTVAFMVPATGVLGSALLNNIKRFLGVAGGKLTGRLLFSMFCPCTWWGPYTAFTATFCYLIVTTLLIFGKSTYSFMSRLAAAFGMHSLLKVCFGRGNGIDSFSLIQAQMIAILFAAAADTVVGNRSASDIACREWKQYTECTLRFVGSLLRVDVPRDKDSSMAMSCSLSMTDGPTVNHRALRRRLARHNVQTTRFGYEALAEPRLTSGRFNMTLWNELVDLSVGNGLIVVLLSAAAAECKNRPLQRAALAAMLKTAAMQDLNASMSRRGHEMAELSEELLASRPRKGGGSAAQQTQEPEDIPSLEDVLRDMSQAVADLRQAEQEEASTEAPSSLASAMDDSLCLVSVIAYAQSCSFQILRQFEVHCYVAQSSSDW